MTSNNIAEIADEIQNMCLDITKYMNLFPITADRRICKCGDLLLSIF